MDNRGQRKYYKGVSEKYSQKGKATTTLNIADVVSEGDGHKKVRGSEITFHLLDWTHRYVKDCIAHLFSQMLPKAFFFLPITVSSIIERNETCTSLEAYSVHSVLLHNIKDSWIRTKKAKPNLNFVYDGKRPMSRNSVFQERHWWPLKLTLKSGFYSLGYKKKLR